MEIVLNELSIVPQAQNLIEARERMEDFLKLCRSFTKFGPKILLRSEEPIHRIEIAPGYPISKWLNDSDVSREIRTFFRSMATSSPLFNKEVEKELYDKTLVVDFTFNDENSVGLGIAHLLDTISVSMNSDPSWNSPYIEVKMIFFEENDCEEFLVESVIVRHGSLCEDLHEHRSWLESKNVLPIYSGEDLWFFRKHLFPSLDFCPSVENNLRHLTFSDPLFKQILKRLKELNIYFSTWSSGPFQPNLIPMKITPESNETLNRFKKEHTFTCSNGIEITFSWHGRCTPGPIRIFFEPDLYSRRGIIGYIGRKLENIRYK